MDNALPDGFKMTELGPLPKEWEVVRLGDVAENFDKKRIPLSNDVRAKKQGRYPYCGANGIIDYINSYIFDGEFLLLAEDGGFFKKFENSAYIMKGKFWVNNHAHILLAKEKVTTNNFLLYWLIYEDISKYVSGTTRQKLTQNVMNKILIPLPPLPEQKKIAAVLSSIQEAREKTEAVIRATKEFKKSMMKHLFTYGPVPPSKADSVPLKETEIGMVPKEWEVVRLGDVAENFDKKRIPLSNDVRAKKQGRYPYCGANGIIDYINSYIFDGEFLLLAEDGGFFKKFENSAYIMKGKFWVNNHAHILLAKEKVTTNNFLLYWLIYEDISKYVSGTTRQKLTQNVMNKILIPLPPLPEQKKIAAVLSAIDDKIRAEENKKKSLDDLFKTLLNDLMTAKIRVNHLNLGVENNA